jgi:hypothetical protein
VCHQQQMQYLLVKWIRLTSFYWFPPKNFFLQGSKNLCRLSNFHRVKKTSNFFKFVKYVCNSKTLSSWNWPTFSKGKRAENSHNTVQVRRSLYIESLRKHAPPSRKHRSRRHVRNSRHFHNKDWDWSVSQGHAFFKLLLMTVANKFFVTFSCRVSPKEEDWDDYFILVFISCCPDLREKSANFAECFFLNDKPK